MALLLKSLAMSAFSAVWLLTVSPPAAAQVGPSAGSAAQQLAQQGSPSPTGVRKEQVKSKKKAKKQSASQTLDAPPPRVPGFSPR
jgi:hypothetical protein